MVKKKDKKLTNRIDNRKIIWREWSDEDINRECWDTPKPSNKRRSMSPGRRSTLTTDTGNIILELFEDLYPVNLPPSLRTKHTWIRASKYRPGVKQVLYSTGLKSVLPDLVSRNEHLLHSEFVRAVASAVHALTYLGNTRPFAVEWETPLFEANTSGVPWRPWHHIYSRGGFDSAIHHSPQLNTLGKYAVRLFWMGCWRKVLVDDLWPLDPSGRLLLPESAAEPELELWPMLLTKALYKLASLTWRPGNELHHFDVITCLTGWVSRHVDTSDMEPEDIWHMCTQYSDHFVYPEDQGPQLMSKNETSKMKTVDEDAATYLLFNCENMRCMDEQVIKTVTPCIDHSLLLAQVRDVPLIKPGSDASRILPEWKKIRWEDWASGQGLWIKDEPPDHIKYLKIVSICRQMCEPLREAGCTPSLATGLIDSTRLQPTFGVNLSLPVLGLDRVIQEASPQINNFIDRKDNTYITLPTQLGTETARGSRVEINTNQNMIFPLTTSEMKVSTNKQNKTEQFEESGVWCNFYNVCDHISSISIYYKPSKFKTSVIVSDLKLSAMRKTPRRTIDADDNTKKKNNTPHKNSIRTAQWKKISMKPAREPLYFFIDSVNDKEVLFSLAVVGSNMPVARAPPTSMSGSHIMPTREFRCSKLMQQTNPCTHQCPCRGVRMRGRQSHTRPHVRARYTTRLVLHTCNWTSHKADCHLLTMRTHGDNSFILNVPNGRHLLILWLRGRRPFVLKTLSQIPFKIGRLQDILRPMTSESKLLTQFSYRIGAAYAKLIRDFGSDKYISSLIEFYQSYKPPVPLNKMDSTLIHMLFLSKFVEMLKRVAPSEYKVTLLFAIRVLFMNPNIKISGLDGLTHFKHVQVSNECVCTDPDKVKLEEKSARIIQSFFKMVCVKKLKQLQDRRHENFPMIVENLTSIYRIMFCRPVKRSYSIEILRKLHKSCNFSQFNKHYSYTSDLDKVLDLITFTGTLKHTKRNEWRPIATSVFHCKNKSAIQLKIHMFCKLPVYKVRVFNNDTMEEFGTYVNQTLTFKCKKNKKGYTAVSYGWTKKNVLRPTRWNMYISNSKLSYHKPLTAKTIVPMDKTVACGNYIPNSKHLICRCVVKVRGNTPAQIYFSTSHKTVQVNLRCTDKNGQLLNSISGTGNVLLPLVFLENNLNNPLYALKSPSLFSKRRSTVTSRLNDFRSDKQHSKEKSRTSSSFLKKTLPITDFLRRYKRRSMISQNMSIISIAGSIKKERRRKRNIPYKTRLSKGKSLNIEASQNNTDIKNSLHQTMNKDSSKISTKQIKNLLKNSSLKFLKHSKDSAKQPKESLGQKIKSKKTQKQKPNRDSMTVTLDQLVENKREKFLLDYEHSVRHSPTREDLRIDGDADGDTKSSVTISKHDIDEPIRLQDRRFAADYTYILGYGNSPLQTHYYSKLKNSAKNLERTRLFQNDTKESALPVESQHRKEAVHFTLKVSPKTKSNASPQVKSANCNKTTTPQKYVPTVYNNEEIPVKNESDSSLEVSLPEFSISRKVQHTDEYNRTESVTPKMSIFTSVSSTIPSALEKYGNRVHESDNTHKTIKNFYNDDQVDNLNYTPMEIISRSFINSSDDESNETNLDQRSNLNKCQEQINTENSLLEKNDQNKGQMQRDPDEYNFTSFQGDVLHQILADFQNENQPKSIKDSYISLRSISDHDSNKNKGCIDTSTVLVSNNAQVKFGRSKEPIKKTNVTDYTAMKKPKLSFISEVSKKQKKSSPCRTTSFNHSVLRTNSKEKRVNKQKSKEQIQLSCTDDKNNDIIECTFDELDLQHKNLSTSLPEAQQSITSNNNVSNHVFAQKDSMPSREILTTIMSAHKLNSPKIDIEQYKLTKAPIQQIELKKYHQRCVPRKNVCSEKRFCMDYMKLDGYRELVERLNYLQNDISPSTVSVKMNNSVGHPRIPRGKQQIISKRTDSLIQLIDDLETIPISKSDIVKPKIVRHSLAAVEHKLDSQNSMQQALKAPAPEHDNTIKSLQSPWKASSTPQRDSSSNSRHKQTGTNKRTSMNNPRPSLRPSTKSTIFARQPKRAKSHKLPTIVEEIVEYYVEAYVINESWPLTSAEWTVVQQLKSRNNVEEEILRGEADKAIQTVNDSADLGATSFQGHQVENTYVELKNVSESEKLFSTTGITESSSPQFETLTKWIDDAPVRIDAAVNTSRYNSQDEKEEEDEIARPKRKSQFSRKSIHLSKRKLLSINRNQVPKVESKMKKPFWSVSIAHAPGQVAAVEVDNGIWNRIKDFKRYCFSGKPEKFIKAKHLREQFVFENYIKWPDTDGDKSEMFPVEEGKGSMYKTYTISDDDFNRYDSLFGESSAMNISSKTKHISPHIHKTWTIYGESFYHNDSIYGESSKMKKLSKIEPSSVMNKTYTIVDDTLDYDDSVFGTIDLSSLMDKSYTDFSDHIFGGSPTIKQSAKINRSQLLDQTETVSGHVLESNKSVFYTSSGIKESSARDLSRVEDKSLFIKSVDNFTKTIPLKTGEKVQEPGECSECKKDAPATQAAYLKRPDSLDKMLPPFQLNARLGKSTCRVLTDEVPQNIYDEIERDTTTNKKTTEESLAVVQEYLSKANRQTAQTRAWFTGVRRDAAEIIGDRILEMTEYAAKLEKRGGKSKSKRK